MKLEISRLSIKNKILIVLSSLPILAIGFIVAMATNVFKDDKLAYVYDSALSSVRGKSSSVSSQIDGFIQSLKAINVNYIPLSNKLTQNGESYFVAESSLKAFMIYSWNGEYFKENFKVTKDMSFNTEEQSLLNHLMQETWYNGFAIGTSKQHPMHLYLVAKVEDGDNSKLTILTVENENFFSLFGEGSSEDTYLYHSLRGRVLGPDRDFSLMDFLQNNVFSGDFAEGTKEAVFDKDAYLTSYSKVGKADLYVVSLVNRDQALSAVQTMTRRSLIFTGLILCVLIIIGVFASNSLTLALRNLADATAQVMDGNFSVRVENHNDDEIGTLAKSFNKMTEEVSRLMDKTAENARMESELQTAHTVQDTLFPKSDAHIGPISIYGKSVPATECGGDWWHYSDKGSKVFIWIGDATGHGVPAALLTSAARAVASVIEDIENMTPSQALSMLNKAIYSTSKGEMMMTFFLACIDFEKNTMTYCNGSHDPPFFLSHEISSQPKRTDYLPLMDVNSPRLGESPSSEYKDFEMKFEKGDRIIFYTDGIVDVKSPEGSLYGERRFLKALSNITEKKVSETVDSVFDNFNNFRQETPLDDDVTLVLVEYLGEQAA